METRKTHLYLQDLESFITLPISFSILLHCLNCYYYLLSTPHLGDIRGLPPRISLPPKQLLRNKWILEAFCFCKRFRHKWTQFHLLWRLKRDTWNVPKSVWAHHGKAERGGGDWKEKELVHELSLRYNNVSCVRAMVAIFWFEQEWVLAVQESDTHFAL